jgi:hypothetical protein
MDHGLYNGMAHTMVSFAMAHRLYNGLGSGQSHDPWVVQQSFCHGPWVVQLFLAMDHGLYNYTLAHDPLVVQHYFGPWAMGCTMVSSIMAHRLYNGIFCHGP